MSHDYHLTCERCGASSEEHNHGAQRLTKAVRAAYPIWLAYRAGWDVRGAELDGLPAEAGFIAAHFDHGGFLVVSEYHRPDDPTKYPPVRVVPEVPGDGYAAVCLEDATACARQAARHLERLLAEVEIDQARKLPKGGSGTAPPRPTFRQTVTMPDGKQVDVTHQPPPDQGGI